MTPDRAREIVEHIELIKAFADGKKIQFMSDGAWRDVEFPIFDSKCFYRIKPEPKYVEFGWQDLMDLVDSKASLYGEIHRPAFATKVVYEHGECRLHVIGNDGKEFYVTPGYLLKKWKFLSGIPCGKLVTE